MTIAILTPVALKCAEIAAPYVWRGLQNGGRHMLKVSENIIDFFRLPVGILQAMKLAYGSFAMWLAGFETWTEATVFALHFIFEAEKCGDLARLSLIRTKSDLVPQNRIGCDT